MNLQLVTSNNVQTYREAAATRIRVLMEDWTNNTLALGTELAKARETFPINPRRPVERPGFTKWAKRETGLAGNHILRLIQISKKFGLAHGHPRLPFNVMKVLSADNVPDSAREEAIERITHGEKIEPKKAKQIADKHRLPSPKKANEQAKEEKRPVLASDGYIYFGTDPGRAKEGEDRRTMVYGVRKALDTLSNIHLTGRQFLEYALPHQLWNEDEAKIIKQALRWLTSLNEAWDSRE
jgi:hypothetical protein